MKYTILGFLRLIVNNLNTIVLIRIHEFATVAVYVILYIFGYFYIKLLK